MKKKPKKRNINKVAKVEQKPALRPSRKFNFAKFVRNIVVKMRIFFKEVWFELKKVSWPNRKTLISYTIVVVVTVLILGLFIGLWDAAFLKLVDLLSKI
jgi:preprotein translocase subunit SecE